jgi:hypothetical protein
VSGNVALEGGPLDGWWYTAGDWDTARQAAVNMGRTKDMPQGQVLGYAATGRSVGHKRLDAVADVWAWKL